MENLTSVPWCGDSFYCSQILTSLREFVLIMKKQPNPSRGR